MMTEELAMGDDVIDTLEFVENSSREEMCLLSGLYFFYNILLHENIFQEHFNNKHRIANLIKYVANVVVHLYCYAFMDWALLCN